MNLDVDERIILQREPIKGQGLNDKMIRCQQIYGDRPCNYIRA